MSNHSQIPWPELPTSAWRDTYATVQLWTQIVGKIRLTKSPWLNHSWHVALYVTPRGLTLIVARIAELAAMLVVAADETEREGIARDLR